MADPVGSDKFLLERLNALKPTSINLDPSPKSVPAASTLERAKPPSREDALSDRLKSLRNQIGSSSEQLPPVSPGSESCQPHTHSSDAIPPSAAAAAAAAQPQASGTDGNIIADRSATRGPTTTGTQQGHGDDVQLEPLLDTDDQTLEELLAELGSDQAWLDEVAAEGEEQEHRRVTALLEELGKASLTDAVPRPESAKGRRSDSDGDGDSDDDSEGGQMTREANDVLAKALDEVELEGNRQRAPSNPTSATPPPADDTNKGGRAPTASPPAKSLGQPDQSSSFELPAVPSRLQDQRSSVHDNVNVNDNDDDDDDDDGDLSETDANFEASIAARMAALKVTSPSPSDNDPMLPLPSVPASDVNALGLPGAPTFSPHDRPVPDLIRRPGRLGFTDEDQKSWCIVCLEDGAIRCLGCDAGDDVYCARCWKEMHVGPRAGYDERGHRWEKYVRAR